MYKLLVAGGTAATAISSGIKKAALPGSAPKAAPSTAKGGEVNIDLGAKRYVSISNFKGRQLVNVREFYDVSLGKTVRGA